MNFPDCDFLEAAGVRRAVVPAGDIREDIGFQNDINLLLARLDAGNTPLKALGWTREAVSTTPAPVEEPILRIIRGGASPRPAQPQVERELHHDPFVGRVAIAIAL